MVTIQNFSDLLHFSCKRRVENKQTKNRATGKCWTVAFAWIITLADLIHNLETCRLIVELEIWP